MSFNNFSDRTADWGRANQWFKDNIWRTINEEIQRDNTVPSAFILGEIDHKFDDLWEDYQDWFAEPKQAEKGGKEYWHRVSVVYFYTSFFLHTNLSIGLYFQDQEKN